MDEKDLSQDIQLGSQLWYWWELELREWDQISPHFYKSIKTFLCSAGTVWACEYLLGTVPQQCRKLGSLLNLFPLDNEWKLMKGQLCPL